MEKNNKILIVDDDLSPLEGHIRLLQAEGYSVKTAESGGEGLQAVINEKPELVILDVVLPDLNGYELCNQIKSLSDLQSPYIVMLSALETDTESHVKGFESGSDDYLTKPIDRKKLSARIKAIFRTINAEKEREKLKARLVQSHKMEAIGNLAGGIAHHFNNLLGVIIGNVSYALSDINKDDELFEVLADVQQGAMQAQKLTQQLLTFATGGAPVKKTADLNQLITETADFILRGEKTRCDYVLYDTLWNVEVDTGQLNQVMSNLVINANQAMPDGGIIKIKTENLEIKAENNLPLPVGKYIKILVEDQGIGISEKHLSKIFDPYFSTKQKGRGLGLATAYSIVKRHNGHINVCSEIDKGTVFNIYLPASLKSVEKTQDKKEIKYTGQGKILIMDDQEAILKMICRMLNLMGYETEFALDGGKSIELFRKAYIAKEPFDLVILDLTVPGGMGGAKVILELLKIDPEVKAVVSSGYSNDPIMANYEDYGFCGMIPKPYTKAQLTEVLNKIFEGKA